MVRVAVPKETLPGETRVALIPESVGKLVKAGIEVVVQSGAGEASSTLDGAYEKAGATIVQRPAEVFGIAGVVAKVQRPSPEEVAMLPSGSTLISLLNPGFDEALFEELDRAGVTALALEKVPRITRAQSMDVLSSQATVAGYKAALIGASQLDKFLPMLTTAAGSIPPAKAFIIGAGVAGLQAIATTRRLGAMVSAFDIRPAAAEQVQSLGATFVASELVSQEAETVGGYAKEQSGTEQERTLAAIGAHIRSMDLVITTAQIPGRPAPRLITAEMVRSMRPGSVIVDLAAESGGNCELTRKGETVAENGVVILGPLNLAATLPLHASQMFSRNVLTLLQHMITDGAIAVDLEDEIVGPMCVARGSLEMAPSGQGAEQG